MDPCLNRRHARLRRRARRYAAGSPEWRALVRELMAIGDELLRRHA